MKTILVVLVSALLSQTIAMTIRTDLKALTDDMVDYINGLETTWKADHSTYFRHKSMGVIRGMMGTLLESPTDGDHDSPIVGTNNHISAEDLPEEFDARQHWSKCPSISEIRDQSNCGSCWAVAAAAAITDRICIGSNANERPRISDEDLLTCCTACGFGCNGGYLSQAWAYWVRSGLVSGGNFTTHDGCQPYAFAPCEHHIDGGAYPPCSAEIEKTPTCQRKCQATYSASYDKDKHYGKNSYSVSKGEEAIKKEIFANGPVEAGYTVFEDFLNYKSGVYQHKAGGALGGHAVKILGWGKENGSPYWLIANSWNSDWGDHGYFKILRGRNECGIEGNIVTGLPKVN